MGKVQFPLVNQRKDVTNAWHLAHITDEVVSVPEVADEYGYYTAWLAEIPDAGTNPNLISAAPKIVGLTEYRGEPINAKTKRINFAQNQFFVNYQTGLVMFHPAQAGRDFVVDYFAKGSLIEADDINYLHDRITKLEKAQNPPVFTSLSVFGINDILEVGQKFPQDATLPIAAVFKWEVERPERIIDESISIKMGDRVLADGITNATFDYPIEFHETYSFDSPNLLSFTINATTINDEPISLTKTYSWVDKIYWDVVPNKDITNEQLSMFKRKMLLPSIASKHELNLNMLEADDLYKAIAVPKRYPIKSIIDVKTGVQFIMDDPIETSYMNNYGIMIDYLVYVSTNKISPEVNLQVVLGA